VGTFAIVFILPEDINLTSGSARYHRNFLDIYLCQFSRRYLDSLLEYQRTLRQRNALLKSMKDGEKESGGMELDVWDKNLIPAALNIMASRREFIREIEIEAAKIVSFLSGSRENVEIAYDPGIDIPDLGDRDSAMKLFRRYRSRDKRYGTTMVGPHRDAAVVKLNGVPLREFGSLGQKKSVMIAMKLAALEVMSAHLRDRAILVLDEAFGEFDRGRAEALLSLLSGKGQVFLASAEEKEFGAFYKNLRVFYVENGAVTGK
jgi:DNA replication and repair protein RecF